MQNKVVYIYFASALLISASIAIAVDFLFGNELSGFNEASLIDAISPSTHEEQLNPAPEMQPESEPEHDLQPEAEYRRQPEPEYRRQPEPVQRRRRRYIPYHTDSQEEIVEPVPEQIEPRRRFYERVQYNTRQERIRQLKELRAIASSPDCDAGYVSYQDGEELCCRGYRNDSENWVGYDGVQCCPKGSSVNGLGQCIACGEGQYYNMGYADLQNKRQGKLACGQRCTRNEDCPSDRFCYMDAHATEADTQINPIIGTCVTPNDVGGIVASKIFVEGQSAGYWIGPRNHLDWWSARNFCTRYAKTDLPTRQQICGHEVQRGEACPSPLRKALEAVMGSQQQASQFWLEATDSGKAYYVDPQSWGYIVKIPPEVTARARSNGVVCGPIDEDDLPDDIMVQLAY